jgi:hypothetical protein
MDGIIGLFSGFTGSGSGPGLLDGIFDLSGTALLLVIGLCLIGTNVLANVTNRTSIFEYAVTFSSLMVGALLSQAWIAHIELPVASDIAQVAVTANIGMTVSALFLMALYSRSGL